MSLKPVLRLRFAQKIAKAVSIDRLNRLLLRYTTGQSRPSEAEMMAELNQFFGHEQKLKYYSPEYSEILRLAQKAYASARTLPDHQQNALAETIYQKSLNLFHLKDYAERSTAYVQVKAIMDYRTTPQCRQMNGRIFALSTLQKEAPNQATLVRSESFWKDAGYFKAVPTSQIIPALPPYHYNCRTRIVPYPRGEKYQEFDSLPPADPHYAQVLRDRLQNYELSPKHLPQILRKADACDFKPKELDRHFAKHQPQLAISSAQQYRGAIRELIAAADATKCLRIEGDELIFYVMRADPESRSKAWFFAVFELISEELLSYYKKKNKDVLKILEAADFTKTYVFEGLKHVKKEELAMLQEDIDLAMNELEELCPIEIYEWSPELIREKKKTDLFLYAQDILSYRTDTLQVLIMAEKLSPSQLKRIADIDQYILSHPVPAQFEELKAWLKAQKRIGV